MHKQQIIMVFPNLRIRKQETQLKIGKISEQIQGMTK